MQTTSKIPSTAHILLLFRWIIAGSPKKSENPHKHDFLYGFPARICKIRYFHAFLREFCSILATHKLPKLFGSVNSRRACIIWPTNFQIVERSFFLHLFLYFSFVIISDVPYKSLFTGFLDIKRNSLTTQTIISYNNTNTRKYRIIILTNRTNYQ